MRGSGRHPGVAATMLVLALTLGSLGALATPTRGHAGTEAAPPGAFGDRERPSVPDPVTAAPGGRPPGVPPYRLATISRASSACPGFVDSPAWLAYDASNRTFWVASPSSSGGCVDEINFTSEEFGYNFITAVPVGTDPFGVAVDNVTNDVFVTNTGSDNVSVISATTDRSIASIDVGSAPSGEAYDWASNEIYVADGGDNNVSIISGASLTVVTTVAVGRSPVGVVADPVSGQVFVADSGSAQVTAISVATNTVVSTIPTGNGSYGLAVDNASDEVFVANQGSDNLSVIDAGTDQVAATVPVLGGMDLQGAAYDSATNDVWVGAGSSWIVEVNATSDAVIGYAGIDPSGVAYDPDNGDLCVTNTGNLTFACLDFTALSGGTQSPDLLEFAESGLPVGAAWKVSAYSYLNPNETVVSTGSTIEYATPPQANQYGFTVPPADGYVADPASGTAFASYYPTTVNVTFTPTADVYPVTFRETGLPNGTEWQANLSSSVALTSSPTATIDEPNGTYDFSVSPAVPSSAYRATPSSGQVVVRGAGVSVNITFSTASGPLYEVTFDERGLPDGTVWTVEFGGSSYPGYTSIQVARPNGTYNWSVDPVAGFSVTLSPEPIVVEGAPVTAFLNFTQNAPGGPYAVTFLEGGLPLGATWTVELDAQSSSSSGTMIRFTTTAGNHTFEVTPPSGYRAAPESGSLEVVGATGVDVYFSVLPSPPGYPVNVTEQGLPIGTEWTVWLGGVPYPTSEGWVSANFSNGSLGFQVGAVSGYTPNPSNGTLTIAGKPVALEVEFFENVSYCCAVPVPGNGNATFYEGLAIGAVGGILLGIVILAAAIWIGRSVTPPRQRT